MRNTGLVIRSRYALRGSNSVDIVCLPSEKGSTLKGKMFQLLSFFIFLFFLFFFFFLFLVFFL